MKQEFSPFESKNAIDDGRVGCSLGCAHDGYLRTRTKTTSFAMLKSSTNGIQDHAYEGPTRLRKTSFSRRYSLERSGRDSEISPPSRVVNSTLSRASTATSTSWSATDHRRTMPPPDTTVTSGIGSHRSLMLPRTCPTASAVSVEIRISPTPGSTRPRACNSRSADRAEASQGVV